MAFPALDVVFGLTTGAIDFLVKILAAMAGQTGHDKARVAPHGPDLDARNDAAFFAPRTGPVEEFLEPAQFCFLVSIVLFIVFHRVCLASFHMFAHTRICRQSKHIVDPKGVTQIHNLRGAVVAVGPKQKLGVRPMSAE